MIVGSILAPVEKILNDVLIWLHTTVGLPWAWAIVALTVIVRILLVTVAIKQIHSMQSLQIHAPEMKAIQQRYKSDRQKQSEELMKFYKENKINPYASCLPIVFQIPIFISLYYTLRHFEKAVAILPEYAGDSLDWLGLVTITEPTKDAWGPLLLVVYVVSQLTSTYPVGRSSGRARSRRRRGSTGYNATAATPQARTRERNRTPGTHRARTASSSDDTCTSPAE